MDWGMLGFLVLASIVSSLIMIKLFRWGYSKENKK